MRRNFDAGGRYHGEDQWAEGIMSPRRGQGIRRQGVNQGEQDVVVDFADSGILAN